MPLYKFRAADHSGKVQELLIEGDGREDAARRVRGRQLVPIECLGLSDAGAPGAKVRWRLRSGFDAVEFTDRLVPLLEADIPLERALAIVHDTSDTPREREIVSAMRRGLHEGRKFSQLVRDRGRLFPPMYASVTEAGEEAGALPQVLGQMRDYLLMTRELKRYVVSSSIYPLIVTTFSLLVVTILLGAVVPRFATIIQQTGREPAPATQLLLHLSLLVNGYWWAILLGIAALIVLGMILRQQRWVMVIVDDLALKLPLVRRMVILSNIGRQVRTMAILMRSGVHLLDTVSISAGVLANERLRQSIAGLGADLRRGERLSAALSRSPYIPALVIRMLAVGEETGDTHRMLERVADRFDDELRTLIKRCLSWFEPVVILALGGLVGLIVLTLFLTILDMQSGL